MPEGEVKIGVVDVKTLAERAGSSQRAKMRELEQLLAIRDQLEKEIEGGFRYGFRTIYQISAGWHEFYRIEGRIEESELIICEYSQLLLELSSLSLRLERTRGISQPSHVPERGAGVARCESPLVISVLYTGNESTAQQQPPQQQQFKTEKSFMVELEMRGEEQEELFQLPLQQQQQQQQQQQPPAAPPRVWTSQLVFPIILETGSERTAQQQPQGRQEQFETGEKRGLEDLVVKLNYEQYLSCSVEAPAAEPVDMWARVGVGTRWLVAVEDAGCGRHGRPGEESFPPFAPD